MAARRFAAASATALALSTCASGETPSASQTEGRASGGAQGGAAQKGGYQQYMQQYAQSGRDYVKAAPGAPDYQKYTKQYAQAGAHYQKYMQAAPGAPDYQKKYMQAVGYQKYVAGDAADAQQYMPDAGANAVSLSSASGGYAKDADYGSYAKQGGDYQKYMDGYGHVAQGNQGADYQKYMKSGQNYMGGYAGSYEHFVPGHDAQKSEPRSSPSAVSLSSAGASAVPSAYEGYMPAGQGTGYQQYMNGYAHFMQGGQGAADYQKYMGNSQGADYEKYINGTQGAGYMKQAGKSADYEKYLKGYAKGGKASSYDKFIPGSAADCQTEAQLKTWYKQQEEQMKYVPEAFRAAPLKRAREEYEKNLARVQAPVAKQESQTEEKPEEKPEATGSEDKKSATAPVYVVVAGEKKDENSGKAQDAAPHEEAQGGEKKDAEKSDSGEAQDSAPHEEAQGAEKKDTEKKEGESEADEEKAPVQPADNADASVALASGPSASTSALFNGLAAVSGIAAVASLVVVAGRRREEPLDAPYLSMEASV